MFNFNEKLLEGAQARAQAIEYRKQISDVYNDLSQTLSEYLEVKVRFYESDEYKSESESSSSSIYNAAVSGTLGLSLLDNKVKTGYKLVYLSTADGKRKTSTLFKTREPDGGYPIGMKLQKSERFCYNQSELVEALSDLLSTVFFHDELQKLKK